MGWVKVKPKTPFRAVYYRLIKGEKSYYRWEDFPSVKSAIAWGRRTSTLAATSGCMGYPEVFEVDGKPWRLWS